LRSGFSSRHFAGLAFALAAFAWVAAAYADDGIPYVPFEGNAAVWHDGFARYDFVMDDQTLAVTPSEPVQGQGFGIKDPVLGTHRCVVIVPKTPANGNPWSWRGCYWDHQPQTEVELLRRGFHIAYISASATLRPGKQWDAWYAFLTAQHGLSKKPAFVGMSRGGEFAYTWAVGHPDEVACIYADNPGANEEVLTKVGLLASRDVPLLHVCGSIDPLLGKFSTAIENIYHQFGGNISVMIKDGYGHHPHSLRDPAPIADFIEHSARQTKPEPPACVGSKFSRTSFYSAENFYREFPKEGTWITCRGPQFTNSYNRYAFQLDGVEGAVTVIEPKAAAAGKPWVYRADFVGQDATVDLALLAEGFHIVTGPVPYNADEPHPKDWDAVYHHLLNHGFSVKPAMEANGGAAVAAYVWAIANPDKVACIFGQNPLLIGGREKPLSDLSALARAKVPILHVCGSRDPLLAGNARLLEERYKNRGGQIKVIVEPNAGHYPMGPLDPAPAVEFVTRSSGLSQK
jgi:pimeloyl-ACP methyl ester carboxylesterase